ncbi:MAG: glycosyltransferase family 2 protein, partial [Nitrococcus sp.]|nr:glycosyltransferase family 2 protein [Nitrococcus sp.]
VLRSDYPNYHVVVCDNASSDGSPERIRDWAAGRLDTLRPGQPALVKYLRAPLAKPIDCLELTRAEAEAPTPDLPDAPLTLIHTGANLGFAGGNNVALRYALARADTDYVWLLNNDTIVAPDALTRLVERMDGDPGAGLCGSMLLDYDDPNRVQALGGARFNPWLGTHRVIGAGQAADAPVDGRWVEASMSYVIGACMLASRRWLEEVGLLCEDYFLYFEEIDWAVRGRRRLRLAVAPRSRVYHKCGATIARADQAIATDCLALRNRLRFTRTRLPWALPTVWLGFLGVLINRICRGQIDRVKPILGIMFGRFQLPLPAGEGRASSSRPVCVRPRTGRRRPGSILALLNFSVRRNDKI